MLQNNINKLLRHFSSVNRLNLFCNNIKYTSKYQPYVDTGIFKGRHPNGRRIVKGNHNIHFDKDFIPISREDNSVIKTYIIKNILPNLDTLYVSKKSIGLSKNNLGINVNLYSTHSYSQYFMNNMFHNKITTKMNDEINIYHFPFHKLNLENIPSEIIMIDPIDKDVIICGTGYAGEIKKSVFTLMNYKCMENNILPMHCAAHIMPDKNETSLFFGLSGTGKTTHSIKEGRIIIGDDEHGWCKEGIFNFENGFYAKTDQIGPDNEPLIYNSIYGQALCENVKVKNNLFDFKDNSITKNGRVSIPLKYLENTYGRKIAPHPKYIFFLSCDVLGVLPHVVKLNKKQALYYYLLGYTSKTPGTEKGVETPKITFSPCFGKVFMPHKLEKYRDKMKEYLDLYNPEIFMINTGWMNGDYKTSQRIDLQKTKHTIELIQTGKIKDNELYKMDNIFNFKVPQLNHLSSTENFPNLNPEWESKAQSLYRTFSKQLKFD